MNAGRPMLYILKDGEPVPVDDVLEWGEWLQNSNDRVVAQIEIGNVLVSTVFLGIDHAFLGGPPILFETMIFGGEFDENQWRYHTLEEAMQGHERAVALVNGEPTGES